MKQPIILFILMLQISNEISAQNNLDYQICSYYHLAESNNSTSFRQFTTYVFLPNDENTVAINDNQLETTIREDLSSAISISLGVGHNKVINGKNFFRMGAELEARIRKFSFTQTGHRIIPSWIDITSFSSATRNFWLLRCDSFQDDPFTIQDFNGVLNSHSLILRFSGEYFFYSDLMPRFNLILGAVIQIPVIHREDKTNLRIINGGEQNHYTCMQEVVKRNNTKPNFFEIYANPYGHISYQLDKKWSLLVGLELGFFGYSTRVRSDSLFEEDVINIITKSVTIRSRINPLIKLRHVFKTSDSGDVN